MPCYVEILQYFDLGVRNQKSSLDVVLLKRQEHSCPATVGWANVEFSALVISMF